MSATADLLDLPGPQRFLAELVEALEATTMVQLVLPDPMFAAPGLADSVYLAIRRLHRGQTRCLQMLRDDEDLPEMLMQGVLEPDARSSRTPEATASILAQRSDELFIVLLAVDVDSPAFRSALDLAKAVRACRIEPGETRLRLLLLLDQGRSDAMCGPSGPLWQAEGWISSTRHWWRAVHRIDTAVYVWRNTLTLRLDDFVREEIIELAAWDLDLAKWLVNSDSWGSGRTADRVASSLKEHLDVGDDTDRLLAFLDANESLDWIHDRHDAPAHHEWSADPNLLAAWRLGLLNRWDGKYVARWWVHLMTRPDRCPDLVQASRWRAQARILTPEIDRYRSEIEGWVRRTIPWELIDDWQKESWVRPESDNPNRRRALRENDVLEAYQLQRLIEDVPELTTPYAGELTTFLGKLRDRRNDVSHMRPVEWIQYDELRAHSRVLARLG